MLSARGDIANAISQKFNDDLLVSEEDRKLAAEKYSSVYHVLDDAELRHAFHIHDMKANRAKRSGRIAGGAAIVLGALALAASATEPLVQPIHLDVVTASIGAILGIISVLLGASATLTGKRKRYWLLHRFATERLRQFHFQAFVYCLPEIVNSIQGTISVDQFKAYRDLQLRTFRSQVLAKLESQFTSTLSEHGAEYIALHIAAPGLPPTDNAAFSSLAAAYRELRLQHQVDYASYKLSESHSAKSSLPMRHARFFELIGIISIALLFLVHFSAISGVAVGYLRGVSYSELTIATLLPVLAMWIAIIALAANAFERGLQPEREIERYRAYLHGIQAILHRFDGAQSTLDRWRAMEDMERLSYTEMRDFLTTFTRAKFVM
jgi:hypothetical protein